MDPLAILNVVSKGISVLDMVWDNRDLAYKAFASVKNIINSGDEVTQEELDTTSADLDSMLIEFNQPLPPEPA